MTTLEVLSTMENSNWEFMQIILQLVLKTSVDINLFTPSFASQWYKFKGLRTTARLQFLIGPWVWNPSDFQTWFPRVNSERVSVLKLLRILWKKDQKKKKKHLHRFTSTIQRHYRCFLLSYTLQLHIVFIYILHSVLTLWKWGCTKYITAL